MLSRDPDEIEEQTLLKHKSGRRFDPKRRLDVAKTDKTVPFKRETA